jgi:transcriptional regulator with XRE-family HTH domain
MQSRSIPTLPLRVERVLKKLGADIKDARIRRRIPMEIMAQRAMISRGTLTRVEKGSPNVSMGIYATVLFILGLDNKLGSIADIRTDDIGLDLEEERLPKRIHLARKRQREKTT